jgi:hypothetical protein
MKFLDLTWCITVALAAGLAGLGLAVGLRDRLHKPANAVEFQRRIDAWQKLDQQLTPEQRLTGPKRAKN